METDDVVVQRAQGRVGATLKGKWTLDQLLGVGGMAAVYAATHRNGKRVAVKILHTEMSVDSNIRQRFLREGYAANRVGHRGAVTVDDDETLEDGSAFLVMELLEGETLDARMRRKGGKLPAAEVLSLADQMLDTLAAAHDKEIVHRDLKPENVFMTREGVVKKILDFGIARIRELSGNSNATQTGSVMGTPAFMPPEQARGRWEDVDARSDLWSVGATLYTLLTGRLVHEGGTPNEALVQAVVARARKVAELEPGIHPDVAEVVDRALVYEKEGRFQSAREMQEAGRLAYRALEGSVRMPALSVPDADVDAPEVPTILTSSESRPATSTTGRAVSASVDAAPPSRQPSVGNAAPPPKVILGAAVAGAALLVAAIALLLRGGDAEPAPAASSPAPANAPVAAPAEPSRVEPAGPVVTPVPADKKSGVSVDTLPVDEEKKKEPERAAKASSDGERKKSAPASSAAPAWLKAAVVPAAPAASAAPKKPKSADPFSKRF